MRKLFLILLLTTSLGLCAAEKAALLKPFGRHVPSHVDLPEKVSFVVPVKIETGFVIIEVHINGKGPFRFILDTGSDSSILSFDLVKKLGLQATETQKREFHTQNNKIEIETFLHTLSELRVGDLIFRNAPFIASNATSYDFQLLKNLNVDGVLGENLFYNLAMTLDLPQHQIVLQNANDIVLHEKTSVLIEDGNYLPIIKTQVLRKDTATPYLFLIDTGYTGFVKMPECYSSNELGANTRVRTLDIFSLPENGFLTELNGTWVIGNLEIVRPIVKYEMGSCVKEPPKWGLIGTQFLRLHKITIDQQHRYVIFYQ